MNYEQLSKIAAEIAVKVGEEIRHLRATGVTVASTKSSQTDIVTESDSAAEKLIVKMLNRQRPNDGVFGEEGSRTTGTTGITWVIDPIDGTVNYLYDLPAYCVSIAACVPDDRAYGDGRKAVAAAVFNPKTDELFTAFEGGGASRNGTPITVNNDKQLSSALLATGFGYTKERRLEQHALLGRVIGEVRDIRRIGTAAYDLCLLASGGIDAYFEKGIQPWDWAAGALIATEAGAVTVGFDNDSPAGEEMFIAAPQHLAEELQSLLRSE